MFKALAFTGLLLVSSPDFGPSEEMFDELQSAPTEEEANDIALDNILRDVTAGCEAWR